MAKFVHHNDIKICCHCRTV